MSGIAVQCPKCGGKVNIGYHSKFHVFPCPHCSRKFRGIHAKQLGSSDLVQTFKDGFHNVMHISTLMLWPSAGKLRGGNQELGRDFTPCPFCTMKINPWANVCMYCTKELPTSHVD
jgi:hypothetical protein